VISVAAVIPHWGRAETTEAAIRALVESTRVPDAVVLVDNHGGRNADLVSCVTRLRNVPLELEIITPDHNLGYLGAAMRAIDCLHTIANRFDFYWILNNDARPRPAALAALLRCAELPDTAIISCSVLDGGEHRPALVYRPWRGRFEASSLPQGLQLGLEGVSGASFLLSAAFLSRIGRLPEHLFMYSEEVWLAWAARAVDMRVVACGASAVDHESGTAVKELQRGYLIREYLDTRARLALTVEWRPECLLTVIPLTVSRAIRETLHGRHSKAFTILAGLVDGLRLRLPQIDSLENATYSTRASLETLFQRSLMRQLTTSLRRR
jgi:GT2 family glycosyltransferase